MRCLRLTKNLEHRHALSFPSYIMKHTLHLYIIIINFIKWIKNRLSWHTYCNSILVKAYYTVQYTYLVYTITCILNNITKSFRKMYRMLLNWTGHASKYYFLYTTLICMYIVHTWNLPIFSCTCVHVLKMIIQLKTTFSSFSSDRHRRSR